MERIHVAVFPHNGSGHINPMLELSHRLIPLGFSVSLILTQNDHAKMKEVFNEDHIHLLSIPNPEGSLMMCGPEFQDVVESALKSSTPPVRCIISDFFIGWSQDVANKLKIPIVSFVTCNAASERMCSNIPLLVSKGYIPLNDHLNDEDLITFLPGIEPIHPRHLPLSWRAKQTIAPSLGVQVQRMKEAFCVLVNTVEELEKDVVRAQRKTFKHYLPVGPLIPSADIPKKGDSSIISWLDKQAPRSVLYVAFGSVATIPADKVEMIAQALKASGKPFLWAIRRNFAKDAPEEFYERITTMFGGQGMVVEWAPQATILRHVSVGAFFTHCGWNSTMEALSSGMPTLCWPSVAEQNVNARTMVEKWKIGLKVAESGDDDGVTQEVIVEKIKVIMEDDEGAALRSRAEGLKNIVDGAYEEGGSSGINLQRFKFALLQEIIH